MEEPDGFLSPGVGAPHPLCPASVLRSSPQPPACGRSRPDRADAVVPEPLERHAFLPASQPRLRTLASSSLPLGRARPGWLGCGFFLFFYHSGFILEPNEMLLP